MKSPIEFKVLISIIEHARNSDFSVKLSAPSLPNAKEAFDLMLSRIRENGIWFDGPNVDGHVWIEQADNPTDIFPEEHNRRLIIEPQKPVGPYTADFMIYSESWSREDHCWYEPPITPTVVVECDGYEFHEKTKEQASHDKRRDREMQRRGYVVFRFSGSDIFNGSDSCATEVLEMCTSIREPSDKDLYRAEMVISRMMLARRDDSGGTK